MADGDRYKIETDDPDNYDPDTEDGVIAENFPICIVDTKRDDLAVGRFVSDEMALVTRIVEYINREHTNT